MEMDFTGKSHTAEADAYGRHDGPAYNEGRQDGASTSSQNIIEAATSLMEAQVHSALSFNKELVGANHSRLLSALAVTRDGAAWTVALSDLRILPDFNIRLKNEAYRAHVADLAQSIEENGYYPDKPIAGYLGLEGKKPVFFVTDGHCRIEGVHLAIAKGCPIKELPLILKSKSTSMEDLTVALVRSNSGKKLSPLEIAIACKRLENFGWAVGKISAKLGITEVYVSQLLTLAGAPKAIRDMIENDETTAAVAIEAMRGHGSDAAKVMTDALNKAKGKGKTKATAKFLPAQIFKKAQQKSAPEMYGAIERITSDKAFSKLDKELQGLLQSIVEKIARAKAELAEAKVDAQGTVAKPHRTSASGA